MKRVTSSCDAILLCGNDLRAEMKKSAHFYNRG